MEFTTATVPPPADEPTVSVVEPIMLPTVALMVELPAATPVAKPPAVIVATPVADEFHVAVLVRFCVLPSLYFPVAVNCSVVPAAIEGFVGVTLIETRAVGVTVRVVEPVMEFKVAAIVVMPGPTLLAKPWLPLALLIVATVVADELQVTDAVRFCGLPLVKFPVATNGSDAPRRMEGFVGVTVIEVRPVTLPVPVSATVIGLPIPT